MPELPEVEVVRRGLASAVTGARVVAVSVQDPRALKRHVLLGGDDRLGGHGVTLEPAAAVARAADFERRLIGAELASPARRGKFMWIPLTGERPEALLAHLGMSGQLLLRANDAADDRHVRVRLWLEHAEHGELRLDFADQRLFGSLAIDTLLPGGGVAAGCGTTLDLLPSQARHIARDPLDPTFDDAAFVRMLRGRSTAVKRALLDQELVSGIGNIYADEALWRTRLHPETPASRLSARKSRELLGNVREVFEQALAEGGTSFDAQYVNVNGQAGYFAHSLNAYGRTGEPCPRCGAPIRRIVIGGRSSHFCPRCQQRRRLPRAVVAPQG